jgi:hypothetical protein
MKDGWEVLLCFALLFVRVDEDEEVKEDVEMFEEEGVKVGLVSRGRDIVVAPDDEEVGCDVNSVASDRRKIKLCVL